MSARPMLYISPVSPCISAFMRLIKGSKFKRKENDPFRKTKANGGKRLVISYMSIGEGEDYRYYWQSSYSSNPLEWLSGPNPDWPGNYKVKYWLNSWKAIIYGGYKYFEGLI